MFEFGAVLMLVAYVVGLLWLAVWLGSAVAPALGVVVILGGVGLMFLVFGILNELE